MKGIDVSQHQGAINWDKVKKAGIEFAMLRVGYSNILDNEFKNNVKGCVDNNIPFGVYLFSYALDEADARREALFVIDCIKELTVNFPVAFDFEYDSISYANQMKVNLLKDDVIKITETFCKCIEDFGYYAMVYTNKDYYNLYYNGSIKDKFDLWAAHWNILEPFYKGGMWQHTSSGRVDGITGNVDLNYAYKDYKTLIQDLGLNNLKPKEDTTDYKKLYFDLLEDIQSLYSKYNNMKLMLNSFYGKNEQYKTYLNSITDPRD